MPESLDQIWQQTSGGRPSLDDLWKNAPPPQEKNEIATESGQKSLPRQFTEHLTGKTLKPDITDPYAGKSYQETLSGKAGEALSQMRSGFDVLFPSDADLRRKRSLGESLTAPFRAAGAPVDIASGALSLGLSPLTAGVRKFVTGPLGYYTGIPAEKIEGAASAIGPGKGGSVLNLRPAPPKTPPTLEALTAPSKGSATSIPGTLQRKGPVDLEALEKAITPRRASPDMQALESEIQRPQTGAPAQQQAPLAIPREGLDPNVRLLPADVSHAPAARASVGAAGAEGILEQTSPEALQMLRNIVREQGFNEHTIEARLEEMSQHEMLAELTPDLEGHLGAIRSLPGNARNEITQTVRQRAQEAVDRIRSSFDRSFGGTINQTEWTREVEEARARESAPFWKQFDSLSISPTPEIQGVIQRLDAAGALQKANRKMRVAGLPETQAFGEERIPTAQTFQYAKEALDDLISSAIASGERGEARLYSKLKADLINSIDNHPDPQVAGIWRQAREAWARPTEIMKAREMGEEALTSTIRADELPAILEPMSDAERRAFLHGVRGRLEWIAGNPGRVEQKLINEIRSPRNQEKIANIIGQDQADQLFGAIEHEQRMHGSPTRVLYGSPTAERRAYQERWQPAGKAMSDVDVIGAATHPVRTAVKAGIKAVAERTLGARSAATEAKAQALRDEVARVLTLQGPERDAVLRYLVEHPQ